MRKILVTGGNGLLGRYVLEALAPDNEITIADNYIAVSCNFKLGATVLDLKTIWIRPTAAIRSIDIPSLRIILKLQRGVPICCR